MPLYFQIIIAVICIAVLIAVIITVSVIAVRRKKSAVKSSAPSAVRSETNPAEEKALPEPIERTPPAPETPVHATEKERKGGTRLTLTDAKAKLSEKEKSYFSTLVSAMR